MIWLLCAVAALTSSQEAPPQIDLWPGKAPGETAELGEEKLQLPKPGEKGGVPRLGNVSRPTIAVYRPSKEKETGAAVVVCPGGGYSILAIEHEGTDVAKWLNSIGVAAVLLKYRVPRRKDDPETILPLQDAQRAMGLVRSRAAEWGIDPKRIGILGFSAGGHLAAHLSTNFESRSYEAVDDADKSSCRPDFSVLVYAGGMVGKENKEALGPRIKVTAETPPAFLAHAGDDKVPAENSILYYLALRKAGVAAELHLFASGGHGFGMKSGENPSRSWHVRCAEWMGSRGYLKAAP